MTQNVTAEDCASQAQSRFELVVIASQRSRELCTGVTPKVEKISKHEKNTVIALREIASDVLCIETLRESVIRKMQKKRPAISEDIIDQDESLASNAPADSALTAHKQHTQIYTDS